MYYLKIIYIFFLKEYSKIIESYLKSNDNTQADYLFFFGDLNFRVEQSIDGVKELLSRSKFTKLLEYDQLNIILKQNESLFKNVKEMNILFPPTYKFDLNTNNYDTSAKKRLFINFFHIFVIISVLMIPS